MCTAEAFYAVAAEENGALRFSARTLHSLPAVRSLLIGPRFLSHTGRAAKQHQREGRAGFGLLPGSHMIREEVSEQLVEPTAN